jgi:hypothetical protein
MASAAFGFIQHFAGRGIVSRDSRPGRGAQDEQSHGEDRTEPGQGD